ncbi:MAG: rhamnan synthesis F family protein, partial [Polyangiaceae bacterium]
MTKRLTIYAHFDAKGQVRRYVTRYLKELRALSDKLVFVSTAPLSEEEVDRLQLHADEVVLKDNVGLDFGMWKHVIDRHELSEYDELVLTNSSIIGPLRPLQPIFSRMASRTCDFWGMTENFDGEWHLQSYFLVLKKKVMRSEAFATFWSSVLPYRSRWQIIRSYEVGFTV